MVGNAYHNMKSKILLINLFASVLQRAHFTDVLFIHVWSGLKAPAEPSLPTHIVYFSISSSVEIFQK